MTTSSVKCPNCGMNTTGDHCEWCSYPLKEHSHGHGKKFFLGLALVLALVLSGGLYAYTYTTASGTIDVTEIAADFATVATAAVQPDWDSLEPTLGGTETLRPNAAGDEGNIPNYHGAAYPNHYQNVDDVTPDGLITDVYSDESAWARDLYNIEDHSLGTGIITAVRIYAHAMSDDLPIQTSLKIVFKSGATVTEGIEQTITTSWADYSQTWITNPATGAAFTWTDIDSLQIGISLRESDSGKESYVTQVWVEVDYGESIGGEAPTGDLFVVYPDANYTGDLAVKVYLTNTANLTKAYYYLNMRLYLEGSVEASETPNYRLLALENGVATFNLEAPHDPTHKLKVIGGSYHLTSDDTSEWDTGWTLTPEFYGEVIQR